MRQWIEYAVENYRSKNSFGFQLAKDLKTRQIDTAIEQYARIVKPEEVVAILDTTVVKSGKSGFLLTDRYLYSSNEKDGDPVELMYLKSVSVREDNNSYCVLEYEDGRKRELYVSVFLDVADVLRMIAGKKGSAETDEAPEHEEKRIIEPEAEGTGRTEFGSGETYLPEPENDNVQAVPVSTNAAGDEAVMEPAADLADELPKELSLEIVGLEELEDEESKESGEPQWDTDTVRADADTQEGADGKDSYGQLLERAEAGDGAAMYEAAEMLYTGGQVQENQKEALRWFRESAKAGYVPAMLKLMQFYEEGELVKKNLTLSMSWAKKAAATGEAKGQFALARAYLYGQPELKDTDKGLGILAEMAQHGHKEAEEMLLEVHQKIKEAKESFRAGIRNPSTASGYYEMGMYCKNGDGYYSYPKEAAEYFRKAAEKDHIHAQYQLALAYYTGAGVKKDEDESVRWLEKAAGKSHKEAGELLAKLQEKHRLRQEKADFRNHLRQAEKGDAYAQSKTAELYLQGVGVKQDIKKGIEWYEKASETDEGYAARRLAKLYSEGEIVPADPEKAAYWRMVGGVLDEL